MTKQAAPDDRVRRGLPFWATLMTLVAVPVMLALGGWQLHRGSWKDAQLARLTQAARLPVLDLGGGAPPPGLQFRRVQAQLACPAQAPVATAGRSRNGRSGFALELACGGGLRLVAGWIPSAAMNRWNVALPPVRGQVTGTLIEVPGSVTSYRLYPDQPPEALPPGLLPAAAPTVDSIPDNHLSYALQWFSFAAIWATLYALFTRRWRSGG